MAAATSAPGRVMVLAADRRSHAITQCLGMRDATIVVHACEVEAMTARIGGEGHAGCCERQRHGVRQECWEERVTGVCLHMLGQST